MIEFPLSSLKCVPYIHAVANDNISNTIPFSFQDTVTRKDYKCRVAFQVLIKPDSYSVGKETIGAGLKVIDSEFENSVLEWSTKEYGTTILYGLLIKAENSYT